MAMPIMHLSVRKRLYAGFGLLIMLAAGVAGFAIHGQTRATVLLTGLETDTGRLNQLDELALSMETTRRAVLRLMVDADPAALATVQTELAGILERLGRPGT